MKIIRRGNAVKERTYLVLIDVFILMCAMGVSLGILFITMSPAFGLIEQRGTDYGQVKVQTTIYGTISNNEIQQVERMILPEHRFDLKKTYKSIVDTYGDGLYKVGDSYLRIINNTLFLFTIEDNNRISEYQLDDRYFPESIQYRKDHLFRNEN